MKVFYGRALIKLEELQTEEMPVIQIEQSMLAKWNVAGGERVDLIAGSNRISLLVRPFYTDKPMIIISEDTRHHLSLPVFSFPVQTAFHKENKELMIGPFLAVLSDYAIEKSNGTFGLMEVFMQEMKTLCEEKGFPFYVHHLQAEKEPGYIEGYWYMDGKWEYTSLPLPDVVYNRIHSRAKEKSAAFQSYLHMLNRLDIPIFNGGFLSKQEVHEILTLNEQLLPFLPETIALSEEEDFIDFIDRHHIVYVKPSSGSQGRNICKLTKTAEGWVLEHSRDIQDTYQFDTVSELLSVLKKNIKKQPYIVQKGIPLLEINGKKIDFRILLNKNPHQAWKITSVVARIGDAGHIVSNLSRGGEMKNGADFLKSAFEEAEAQSLYKKICLLGLQTANCLTEHRTDLFGELGIDIALDIDKQPWLIEINSKPSKAYQGSYEKFRPSVKAIVEYMHSLYKDRKDKRP